MAAGTLGASIGGGGFVLDSTVAGNQVIDNFGAVGGGFSNSAAHSAVVAGGVESSASGYLSAVGGGRTNVASGQAGPFLVAS